MRFDRALKRRSHGGLISIARDHDSSLYSSTCGPANPSMRRSLDAYDQDSWPVQVPFSLVALTAIALQHSEEFGDLEVLCQTWIQPPY